MLNTLFLAFNSIDVEETEKKMIWKNDFVEKLQLSLGVVHIMLIGFIVLAQIYVRTRVIWNDESYQKLKKYQDALEPIADKYNDEDQQVLALCKRSPRTLKLKDWVIIISQYDKKVMKHHFSLPFLQIITIRTC